MPWFHRAWVLQEVALAKKVVVALDCCLVPWEKYFAALETLMYLELEKAADWVMHAVAEARRSYLAALVLDIAISRVDWFESNPKKRPCFSRLVLFFRASEATDIRDKLFAVWNLSAQAISSQSHRFPYFPMTYTMPIEKIYASFVDYCIRTEGLLDAILGSCKYDAKSRNPHLPSWIYDLKNRPQDNGCSFPTWLLLRKLNRFNVAAALPEISFLGGDEGYLKLSGVLFDTVTEVSSVEPDSDMEYTEAEGAIAVSPKYRHASLRPMDPDPNPYVDNPGRLYAATMAVMFGPDESASEYDESPEKLFVDACDVYLSERNANKTAHRPEDGRHVQSILGNRRLFRTQRAYIGTGCMHVRVGDKACILRGGRFPFLLREVENDAAVIRIYSLVGGPVYIHGIMHGEAVELFVREDIPEVEFHLV
jgi:hypothetical protein